MKRAFSLRYPFFCIGTMKKVDDAMRVQVANTFVAKSACEGWVMGAAGTDYGVKQGSGGTEDIHTTNHTAS